MVHRLFALHHYQFLSYIRSEKEFREKKKKVSVTMNCCKNLPNIQESAVDPTPLWTTINMQLRASTTKYLKTKYTYRDQTDLITSNIYNFLFRRKDVGNIMYQRKK